MCGIIGYTGERENAVSKMTKGLEVLEYRGYDSAGIAASCIRGIVTVKCRGRIKDLKQALEEREEIPSRTAIGHTRWATHGGPSDSNAHPHSVGCVTLVHNGIIENYRELRAELGDVEYRSETDTEVAAALLDASYRACGDPLKALQAAASRIVGSYAFAVLFADHPDEVFAMRFGSPLLVARGEDGSYLASDMTALLPFSDSFYRLEEGEMAHLSASSVELFTADGTPKEIVWEKATMSPEAAQKGGYSHFMLKEMHEQPQALIHSVKTRIKNGLPDLSVDGIDEAFLKRVKSIQLVACGSAMHAGLVGAKVLERMAGIPTTVHIASEYRYHPPLATEGTLVVIISQSGETADSLAALRHAKREGHPTLAIVNAVESSIAREADACLYTYAGPEIAVATTKGYCTQVSVLCLLAAALGRANGKCSEEEARSMLRDLTESAPMAMEKVLSAQTAVCTDLAKQLAKHEHLFYIGRGLDYSMSLEAALKLKEISYLHCEAYAAGELKHGTISLVEEGTPVLAISTDPGLYEKTESNIREVRSRGAYVVLICREDAKSAEDVADEVIRLPADSSMATLFSALACVQMLAFHTAQACGCDIDRPRNLAKSVTVE